MRNRLRRAVQRCLVADVPRALYVFTRYACAPTLLVHNKYIQMYIAL